MKQQISPATAILSVKKIALASPVIDEEMKLAAVKALENEFLVLGESVEKFEQEFARYLGVKHCVAVGSGTAALQIALLAAGVGKGDGVVTSAFTFPATAFAIEHANAKLVLCDVEESTANIDAGNLRYDGEKAIIPVHLYGQPAAMDEINDFARDNGTYVIEDACQAHGAEYKGSKAGALGDASCFSFYSTKNMTAGGDGGAIATSNDEIAEKALELRNCGRAQTGEHVEIGFTSRLNTVNAAIARIQLRRLDAWNEKRRKLAKVYRELLPPEILLDEKPFAKHVYHLFVVKLPNRDAIAQHLTKHGIETKVHYGKPIHLQPAFLKKLGYKQGDFPVAEKLASQVLSLPMHPRLSETDVQFVCEKLLEVLR